MPRLAHKKSRKGCQQCKSRKVKCTEERPACTACKRHELPCEYQDEALSQQQHKAALKGRVCGPVIPYSFEPGADDLDSEHYQRRLLELQLLHYYVSGVAGTFPSSEEDCCEVRTIYSVEIVKTAFRFPFLLNTIFAISALHKTVPEAARLSAATTHHTMPHGAAEVNSTTSFTEYARAHRVYLNTAIKQQREAILQLGPGNAEAICFNSILLSFIALKLLPETTGVSYEPPIRWLSMSQAIGTLMKASHDLISERTALAMMMHHTTPNFNDPEVAFDFDYPDSFRAILNHPDPDPIDSSASSASSSSEIQATYTLTMGYINGVRRAIRARDPQRQIARRLLSFGPVLPLHFVALVEARRPKALVILAHLMAMAKYVENYWFFHGFADREVRGIRSILSPEWLWAMEWPLRMLEKLSPPPTAMPGF